MKSNFLIFSHFPGTKVNPFLYFNSDIIIPLSFSSKWSNVAPKGPCSSSRVVLPPRIHTSRRISFQLHWSRACEGRCQLLVYYPLYLSLGAPSFVFRLRTFCRVRGHRRLRYRHVFGLCNLIFWLCRLRW